MTGHPSYAVLLMTHGGPDSLDDLDAYLRNVRGGRPTPPDLVTEFRRRYTLIGGRSPLLEITQSQAKALSDRLGDDHGSKHGGVYVGMRHWHPYIRDAVTQLAQDGRRHVVAICMAPQYSRTTVGAYFGIVRQVQDELGADLDFAGVESWHDHPLLVQAFARKLLQARQRFPSDVRDRVRVLFTAHSMPVSALDASDPYQTQVLETAQLVSEACGLAPGEWELCYQSAGARQGEWLGPRLDEVVARLIDAGDRHILVAPIGFVADNLEVLYDLDIEARALAKSRGVDLQRTESLNADPTFIDALADVVVRRLDDDGRQGSADPI